MKKQITTIPAKALAVLSDYPWSGNVRELENFIERAVILSRGPDLEVPLSELKQQIRAASPSATASLGTLQEAEREHILRALQQANWRIRLTFHDSAGVLEHAGAAGA